MSEEEDVVTFEDDDATGGLPVEEGAPLWMATFGDMMSLLLCFFILMFSMSELKMERFQLAAQSMNQAMGSTSPEPVESPMGLMIEEADPDLQLENPGDEPRCDEESRRGGRRGRDHDRATSPRRTWR
jgi:flagellar motor protein MotB